MSSAQSVDYVTNQNISFASSGAAMYQSEQETKWTKRLTGATTHTTADKIGLATRNLGGAASRAAGKLTLPGALSSY